MKTTVELFDEFFTAVIETALWTNEHDQYSIDDIDRSDLEAIKAHAHSFWLRMWYYIDYEKQTTKQAGHDFWLTSQGHGAGFWDGDWPMYGEMLTKLSKCYPAEMSVTITGQEVTQ